MQSKATLLVVGDPGPVRAVLLARGDIEVLWVNNAGDALTLLRSSRPALCLVSVDIGYTPAMWLLENARERTQTICVLLVDPKKSVAPTLVSRTSAVIPFDSTEAILAVIAFHTGLAFARHPRTSVQAAVRVSLDGEDYVLEAENLSVSGIAIKKFPYVEVGRLVHLELELQSGSISADARVVRYAYEGSAPIAGLAFERISFAHREKIRQLVESVPSTQSALKISDLFEDITVDVGQPEALRTTDIHHTADLQTTELDPDPELRMLRAYLAAGTWPSDAPQWLVELVAQLTNVEIAAALGVEAPDWAKQALSLRICLERVRTGRREAKVPSVLADLSYRMFDHLKDACPAGADASLVGDVAKIRAGILRLLLAPAEKRAGAALGAALNPARTVEMDRPVLPRVS